MIGALLHVLSFHRGRHGAIPADELLARMRRMGNDIPTISSLRDLIHDARKDGHLIASCDQGYFVPADKAELTEFVDKKLRGPAFDLLQTARILRSKGRQEFPDPLQPRMM